MIAQKDLYKIIGLSRDCTTKEIRTRYQYLSKKLHPDRNVHLTPAQQDAKAQLFQDVFLAYSVLVTPELRAEYDLLSSNSESEFGDLKRGFEKHEEVDISKLSHQHKQDIETRHKDLLQTYRERNIAQLTKERDIPTTIEPAKPDDIKRPVRRQSTCKEIVVQPLTLIESSNKVTYQVLSKIGEMYWAGEDDITLRDYTLDITREDVTNARQKQDEGPSLHEKLRTEKTMRSNSVDCIPQVWRK
jgi:curved DNA-binding protein CbpA